MFLLPSHFSLFHDSIEKYQQENWRFILRNLFVPLAGTINAANAGVSTIAGIMVFLCLNLVLTLAFAILPGI